MSLKLYNQKRDFKKTAEPEGKQKASKGHLRFVIQKHDASHLHYDFRLEMEGVLKSWAVPKGPSLNPADKRLAMMVEDHPFAYRNFEGVIPAGEYGGGTVIVWDEGTYEPVDGEELSRKEQEKMLLQQLNKGKIGLQLHGEKLNGEFTIFHIKSRGENAWILMKKEDEFSTEDDITTNEISVKTGKTLVEVAHDHGTEVNHPEAHLTTTKKTSKLKPATKKAAAKQKSGKANKAVKKLPAALNKLLTKGENAPMKTGLIPMMANLATEPFDKEDWIYEIKWDGYRALAYCNNGETTLSSRNLNSFTDKYLPVTEALNNLALNAVLDGEIIAVEKDGKANFQLMQNWQNTTAQLQFFVFDLLWLNGYDLTSLPLTERKEILKELLPPDDAVVKYSDHVAANGKEFFAVAMEQGLEGIMAKKADSPYTIGKRSNDWLKIKVNQRQEVVIAGYTEPRQSRQYFGSLLLGVYDKNELVYVGHTGSGFNSQSLAAVHKQLQKLETKTCPFKERPKTNMPATWVKPTLVCEIKFTEWTSDGVARHPIFMGMRSDKKAKDVHMEKAAASVTTSGEPKNKATKEKPQAKPASKKAVAKKTASKKTSATKIETGRSKKTKLSLPKKTIQLKLKEAANQQITLNGTQLQLTNLQKIYWPKEGFRKGDMINYYLQMAPIMLPYLLDRPQSMNRHPNGIKGANFFQKDVRGKAPDWAETFEEFSESTNESIDYFVCSNEASLIYMANLGCIEMNPWHSRTSAALQPDWCLIDLDPDTTNSFEQVIEVAHVVKKILDAIGADNYIKTSGSSGLHIYVPLGAKYSYEQSRQLAELVVNLALTELPDLTSVERSPAKRKGKIYLDFLQNREIQTAAAPYSLRPKPGMPVSTPLDWSEVKKGLTQTTWNATNIFDRVKAEGDLFAPVLKKGIDLVKVLSKMQKLF